MLLTPPPAPPPPGDSPPAPPPPPPFPSDGRRPDGTFGPGNPGKRLGTKNRATVILQSLFEGGAAEIGTHILAAIKQGDMTAARIVVDRLYPTRRGAPVSIPDFPEVKTASDVPAAHAALLAATTAGEISPDEAAAIAVVLDKFVQSVETVELAQRLDEMERRLDESKNHGSR